MLEKKNIFIIFFVLFLSSLSSFSQENKSNPILYVDTYFGGTSKGCFAIGYSINYQKNKDLFGYRNIYSSVFYGFDGPDFTKKDKVIDYYNEHSILYGKRYIYYDYSFSFLIGLSYSGVKHLLKNEPFSSKDHFIGFPYEIGVKLFKSKKRPIIDLGYLISIGKPTGFSSSVGLKIYGNLSKQSYIGMGLSLGFGWHKKY